MFIKFFVSQTSIAQLREDVLTEGRGWEEEAWDDMAPMVYLLIPDPVTHFPYWTECRRGSDGKLVETRVNINEVGVETWPTRFETHNDTKYHGECVAVWITATSGYRYNLVEYHQVGDPRVTHQRWEYRGPAKGFRSQKLLPEAITFGGVYPSIFAATGTYGRFNDENSGGRPLEAYLAAKTAWEAPYVALTGLDTAAAAKSWQARKGLKDEPAALDTLFRAIGESDAKKRRYQRLAAKQERENPLPAEIVPGAEE